MFLSLYRIVLAYPVVNTELEVHVFADDKDAVRTEHVLHALVSFLIIGDVQV